MIIPVNKPTTYFWINIFITQSPYVETAAAGLLFYCLLSDQPGQRFDHLRCHPPDIVLFILIKENFFPALPPSVVSPAIYAVIGKVLAGNDFHHLPGGRSKI